MEPSRRTKILSAMQSNDFGVYVVQKRKHKTRIFFPSDPMTFLAKFAMSRGITFSTFSIMYITTFNSKNAQECNVHFSKRWFQNRLLKKFNNRKMIPRLYLSPQHLRGQFFLYAGKQWLRKRRCAQTFQLLRNIIVYFKIAWWALIWAKSFPWTRLQRKIEKKEA